MVFKVYDYQVGRSEQKTAGFQCYLVISEYFSRNAATMIVKVTKDFFNTAEQMDKKI